MEELIEFIKFSESSYCVWLCLNEDGTYNTADYTPKDIKKKITNITITSNDVIVMVSEGVHYICLMLINSHQYSVLMKDVEITFHDKYLKVKTAPIVLRTGITFSIQTSLSVSKESYIENIRGGMVVKNLIGSGGVIVRAIHLCPQPYITKYMTSSIINPTKENLLESHMLSPCVEVSIFNLNSRYKIGLFSGFTWLTYPILYNGKEITSKEYYAISVIKSLDALDAMCKSIKSATVHKTNSSVNTIEKELGSVEVLSFIHTSNAYFMRIFLDKK